MISEPSSRPTGRGRGAVGVSGSADSGNFYKVACVLFHLSFLPVFVSVSGN